MMRDTYDEKNWGSVTSQKYGEAGVYASARQETEMDHYIDAGELDTSCRPSKKKKKPNNINILNKSDTGKIKCCAGGGRGDGTCTIF